MSLSLIHIYIIIRGGENIAPHEVDEILLRHSAVAAAVTFGCVHPTLSLIHI